MYFKSVVVERVVEAVRSIVQEQFGLWMKQGSSDERHWKRSHSQYRWRGSTGYEQESVLGSVEVRKYGLQIGAVEVSSKLGRGPRGGTTCLVMGLVFKTSRAAARVVAGGFDSHVPPPVFGINFPPLRTAIQNTKSLVGPSGILYKYQKIYPVERDLRFCAGREQS